MYLICETCSTSEAGDYSPFAALQINRKKAHTLLRYREIAKTARAFNAQFDHVAFHNFSVRFYNALPDDWQMPIDSGWFAMPADANAFASLQQQESQEIAPLMIDVMVDRRGLYWSCQPEIVQDQIIETPILLWQQLQQIIAGKPTFKTISIETS